MTIWIVPGLLALLWLCVREGWYRDGGGMVLAVLCIFPAMVAGPFVWIAVAIAEWDRPDTTPFK